ncbi:unnamed protein product [Linum trigynum]|uniref:Uncharacterized protein n=1 Tax=Linum trigynum TaxID=586398 RepID=A0AAV2E575_9ROSI
MCARHHCTRPRFLGHVRTSVVHFGEERCTRPRNLGHVRTLVVHSAEEICTRPRILGYERTSIVHSAEERGTGPRNLGHVRTLAVHSAEVSWPCAHLSIDSGKEKSTWPRFLAMCTPWSCTWEILVHFVRKSRNFFFGQ